MVGKVTVTVASSTAIRRDAWEVTMGTKPQKREVMALEYQTCHVMAELTRIFAPHCPWWEIYRGLNLEVINPLHPLIGDVQVRVFPVGWPEHHKVIIRFVENGSLGWTPIEGCVSALNGLPHGSSSQFNFKIDLGRKMEFTGRGTAEEEFLNRIES